MTSNNFNATQSAAAFSLNSSLPLPPPILNYPRTASPFAKSPSTKAMETTRLFSSVILSPKPTTAAIASALSSAMSPSFMSAALDGMISPLLLPKNSLSSSTAVSSSTATMPSISPMMRPTSSPSSRMTSFLPDSPSLVPLPPAARRMLTLSPLPSNSFSAATSSSSTASKEASMKTYSINPVGNLPNFSISFPEFILFTNSCDTVHAVIPSTASTAAADKKMEVENCSIAVIKPKENEISFPLTYTGGVKENMPHCEGTISLKQRSLYASHWKEGVPSGFFKLNTERSNLSGQLNEGFPVEAKGTKKFPNGGFLTGTFRGTDFFEGSGKLIHDNEAIQEGEWQGGKFVNGSIHYLKTGDKYKGKFVDARLFEGEFLMHHESGAQCLFTVRNGVVATSKGFYRDHSEIEGEYLEDRSFKGVFHDIKQDVYHVGTLSFGSGDKIFLQGEGKMVKPDHFHFEGKWENGRLVKGRISIANMLATGTFDERYNLTDGEFELEDSEKFILCYVKQGVFQKNGKVKSKKDNQIRDVAWS